MVMDFPSFLNTFLSVKLRSPYYLPFHSAYYLTKFVPFYPVFLAYTRSCQQTYKKVKARTQVCVNKGDGKKIRVNTNVVECLSSPFICLKSPSASCIFHKYLQLTRDSLIFLIRNKFPRLSYLS